MMNLCQTCKKEYKTYPSCKSKYCSQVCSYKSLEWRELQRNAKIGKKMSDDAKHKMSVGNKGKKQSPVWIKNKSVSLKKYWDKKGRKNDLYTRIKISKQYKKWRLVVFERDEFTCQDCGDKRGGNLEADHLISFAFLLEEGGILQNYKGLWDIDNGKTRCTECHKKTDSYACHLKHHTEHKMLAVIINLWEQTDRKITFEQYYREKMEVIINWLKEKLD